MKVRLNLPGILITTTLVSLVAFTAAGCAYKTFTLEEGIAHFSFEYPSNYKLHSVKLGNIFSEFTTIDIYSPLVVEGISPEVHDAEILIQIYQADSRVSNSTQDLESFLSNSSQRCEDFKLLERSDITIDGIQGEQVVFSYTSLIVMDYHIGMHIVRPPAVGRIAYFNYNGKIWRIMIEGHKDLDDTWKADYEHLIETLQILD